MVFQEYTSGERSKEMHVNIDKKENKNILRYIKMNIAGI